MLRVKQHALLKPNRTLLAYAAKAFVLLLQFFFVTASQSGDLVVTRSLADDRARSHFHVFTPDYVQVTAGTLNVNVHGIFQRDDELEMNKITVPWYGEQAARPVYKQLSAKNPLFIYWSPTPVPQWRIGGVYPISNPLDQSPSVKIKAIMPSMAPCPAFSRGWFVLLGTLVEDRQIALKLNKMEVPPSSAVYRPDFTKIPKNFRWDFSLTVDEARPGTFSAILSPDMQPGCPENAQGGGISSVKRYLVDPCLPPRFDDESDGTFRPLEFTLTGADGILRNALFSWGGYFLRRPYFELRSPVNPDATYGTSAVHPSVLTFWADNTLDGRVEWYISRELGNKHSSQLFARWALSVAQFHSFHKASGADWPAEIGVELLSTAWTLVNPSIKRSELIGTLKEASNHWPSTIRLKAVLPGDFSIIFRQGPDDIQGEYYVMGDYLGYPFFRQKLSPTAPGYALFRSHSLAADRDCWIIGSILGSSQGLRGYACDAAARSPQQIEVSWWFWDKNHSFLWKRLPDVSPQLTYKDPSSVPAIRNALFPPCPLPTCVAPLELPICPPSGTCSECVCDKAGLVRSETAIRQAAQGFQDVEASVSPQEVCEEVFDGKTAYGSNLKFGKPKQIVKGDTFTTNFSWLLYILMVLFLHFLPTHD